MLSIAVDFLSELNIIWGVLDETRLPGMEPGEGFPPGVEYQWVVNGKGKTKTVVRCSANEYVNFVLTWVDEQINDAAIFPTSSGNFNCSIL